MFLRLFFVLTLLVSAPAAAGACRYVPVPLEVSLERATTVFIGDVLSVDAGKAVFRVEKAIRGVADGDTLSVQMATHSCGIRFQPGQRWLYLGELLPSGSLLLRDEAGNIIKPNAEAAETAETAE